VAHSVDLERQHKEKQMGRPLKKDVNGVNVIGTFDGDAGIKVQGYFGGSLRSDYYIRKQRGAKTYVVTADGTTNYTGVLVSAEPAVNGQIRILGSLDGTSPGTVAIAKLTKRVATDFSGNRYNWVLSNYQDSTGDVIVLTAI
jgi:cytoskeletal protein CcmA (bactofilin family)